MERDPVENEFQPAHGSSLEYQLLSVKLLKDLRIANIACKSFTFVTTASTATALDKTCDSQCPLSKS
jgi:hypothetical protein